MKDASRTQQAEQWNGPAAALAGAVTRKRGYTASLPAAHTFSGTGGACCCAACCLMHPGHTAAPSAASCTCMAAPTPPAGKIVSVETITGPKATGETCHIIIQVGGGTRSLHVCPCRVGCQSWLSLALFWGTRVARDSCHGILHAFLRFLSLACRLWGRAARVCAEPVRLPCCPASRRPTRRSPSLRASPTV